MQEDLRPSAFVVMPYGTKADPTTGVRIDFDDVWTSALRPAAEQAGVVAIRADEERLGGFVHLAMFERLLLAEIVIADLTLTSPNVMYELGIRHATRPRATIPIFASMGTIPFDLSPIRAIPYRLDAEGRLAAQARTELVEQLAARLSGSLVETSTDSPLFQLIKPYPGVTLPHDVTESFQDRVQKVTSVSRQIRSASSRLPREEAFEELRETADQLLSAPGTHTELLMDVLLAFRDVEGWDDMVRVIDALPRELRDHLAVVQLKAFALNRRNGPGDRREAGRLLDGLLDQFGPSPETLGLLGRVHKDRYDELRSTDPSVAHEALLAAIDAYERGFRADLRDYYPGVNAVTLLLHEGSDESYRRARQLSPVVAFAVAARRGMESRDYWDVATVLELAVVNLDVDTARRATARLCYLEGPDWRRETTTRNLNLLREAHERRGETVSWLHNIIERIALGDRGA